ncbi:MAG: cobalamin-binding protein [Planctomycetes bacterium]|nr:cobalamin-binding protein [Planctomycetota bacterium]
MRIVSLLPGATETVCALGLADSLVGVSHECDHPREVLGKPRLTRPSFDTAGLSGGEISIRVGREGSSGRPLYHLDAARLASLRPDLVLTQSICGVCAVDLPEVERVARAMESPPRVLSLDPSRLEDVLEDVRRVGAACGAEEAAERGTGELRARIRAVADRAGTATRRPRAVYLEWLDPPMVGGHWIPEMIATAGGEDPLGRAGEPSRRVGWDEVARANPDLLVLGPCGFDLPRARGERDSIAARPGFRALWAARFGETYLVDASAHFSRPGPRLVNGLEILAAILHPDLFPARPGAFERA